MTAVGWCPGGRPVEDMLALYPGTRVVRIFVGMGKPLPTWDGPILGPLDAGVLVHLSFKTWDLPGVERWLAAMPEGRTLVLTYAHEPEQGTAAGDPTPEEFHGRWAELVHALAEHPRRGQVLLVPVYTRYWWQAHPGDLRWLVTAQVDAHGWDIYNNGTSYRSPDDLLSIPRQVAAQTGLPYLIAELGAVRLAGDLDGSGRTAWMRQMVAAAQADGAWSVCWFHKDEWDLATAASAPEQQTLRELIQEANVAWYLNHALTQFRQAVNEAYPNRDKASDGTIGDAAHASTSSDHNPDPSWESDAGSVDAWDMDVDLRSGDDPAAIERLKDVFEAHESSRYWIHNRQIASRSDGWVRRHYDGANPHDKHVHWNTREGYEGSNAPWELGDDFMSALTDAEQRELLYAVRSTRTSANVTAYRVAALVSGALTYDNQMGNKAARNVLAEQLGELAKAVNADQPDPVDEQALAAAIAAQVTTAVLAALPDGDEPVSREDLEAALRSVLGSVDNPPQS